MNTPNDLYKKLIFFNGKDSWIYLFVVENNAIITVIIRHYLWPNSTAFKLCYQKYEYVVIRKFEYSFYAILILVTEFPWCNVR